MDEDVAAGGKALRFSEGDVGLIRIGDANRKMIRTVGVALIDYVSALRGPAVSLELLVTLRSETQPDRIGLQDAIGSVENKQALSLLKPNTGDFGSVIAAELAGTPGQKRYQPAQQDGAAGKSDGFHCSMPLS